MFGKILKRLGFDFPGEAAILQAPQGFQHLPGIGCHGRSTSLVTDGAGQVEVQGELWEARTQNGVESIPPGTQVIVAGLADTRLVVGPLSSDAKDKKTRF